MQYRREICIQKVRPAQVFFVYSSSFAFASPSEEFPLLQRKAAALSQHQLSSQSQDAHQEQHQQVAGETGEFALQSSPPIAIVPGWTLFLVCFLSVVPSVQRWPCILTSRQRISGICIRNRREEDESRKNDDSLIQKNSIEE